GDEPPPVSLAEAVASVVATASPTTTATATSAATSEASSTPTAEAASTAGESLDGSWTVDASQSFLGYRINEELASVGSTTAVGRTSTIEGVLEFDGSAITGVSITADLRDLASDDSRRDGQLRRQALQTNTFPEATFVLSEPISIAGDPGDGGIITATAIGDLTIHGVTNRVEIPIEGQYVDGQVVVVASTVVLLADYDIEKPSAVSVLSVSDEATIELQLVFSKA
ncbi:MAG: YceI family protein, partial [Dehalococcoidia bacterium]